MASAAAAEPAGRSGASCWTGECALPPLMGTRPAGGRAERATPARALRAAGPALRQRRPRCRPHLALPSLRPALPSAGTARHYWPGGARGRDAGRELPMPQGDEPCAPAGSSVRMPRLEPALLQPASFLKAKLDSPAQRQQSASCRSGSPLFPPLAYCPLSSLDSDPYPQPPMNVLLPRSQSFILNRLPNLATASGQLGSAVHRPFTSPCGLWK